MSNEVITLLDILSGTAEKIISTPDVIILTTLSLPGRILWFQRSENRTLTEILFFIHCCS